MYRLKGIFFRLIQSRRILIILGVAAIGLILYQNIFRTLTVNPVAEKHQMERLEATKQVVALSAFVTDGCSGNVSAGWKQVIEQLSTVSDSFADSYADVTNIPFETACVLHDQRYHLGEGSYDGRLQADNELRTNIMQYGIDNAALVRTRTSVGTDEEVILLYEMIAEVVYRGVRLGGAPCTGEPYAWGYGYGAGGCVE